MFNFYQVNNSSHYYLNSNDKNVDLILIMSLIMLADYSMLLEFYFSVFLIYPLHLKIIRIFYYLQLSSIFSSSIFYVNFLFEIYFVLGKDEIRSF